MAALTIAACSGLLSLVVGLVAWSARREMGLADARFVDGEKDTKALEERLRLAELAHARTDAKADAINNRLDDLVTELHQQRDLLQQILSRLPKRSSDSPIGGHHSER